jgi:hypothetical protein
MIQVLFHLWGDYIFQNDYLATNKIEFTLRGWIACFIHSILYSIPFLFIGSLNAVTVIFITHFFIDKFRLAKYIIRLKNWEWKTKSGFPESTPPFIYTWVIIIVDNIIHVTINYFSLLNL